jgi:hypothetical protein
MKPVYLKILIVLPFVLFLDWVIMVVFGCFASICNANDKFYCSVFCKVGIVLLSLTILFFVFWLVQKSRKKPVE